MNLRRKFVRVTLVSVAVMAAIAAVGAVAGIALRKPHGWVSGDPAPLLLIGTQPAGSRDIFDASGRRRVGESLYDMPGSQWGNNFFVTSQGATAVVTGRRGTTVVTSAVQQRIQAAQFGANFIFAWPEGPRRLGRVRHERAWLRVGQRGSGDLEQPRHLAHAGVAGAVLPDDGPGDLQARLAVDAAAR